MIKKSEVISKKKYCKIHDADNVVVTSFLAIVNMYIMYIIIQIIIIILII